MNNISIHLEGLDLAGKSTITRVLAQKSGAQIRRNALMEDNPIHKRAEVLRKTNVLEAQLLGWIYLGALSFEMQKYQKPQSMFIQDSTIILRSIAYHKAMGNTELADAFESLIPYYPRFTASFVLTASDQVRLMRLNGRIERHNDNPEDYFIRSNPDLFHRMEQILIQYASTYFNAVVIDASLLEKEGEKDAIANRILSLAGYNQQ